MKSKKPFVIALISSMVVSGAFLSGCAGLGGSGDDEGEPTSSQGAQAQKQSGTGTNRVSTTKKVGDESTGYIDVPASYQEVGENSWAERSSSFTSKDTGSTLYTEYASMGYSLSSYAIVGQTWLKDYKSDESYRNVESTNTTFKGNAAFEITARIDELYEKTIIFDAGAGTGGTRILTIVYARDAESELESVMDSWTATP